MEGLLLSAVILTAAGTAVVGWMNRAWLVALWREPVLKRPVLIVESDDWGAGPPEQAKRLDQIAAVLASHADRAGRRPVMTLGVVLAVADGARILAEGFRRYHCKSLDHPELGATLAAIRHGAEKGVFALQLHGEEHYWPPALLSAARGAPSLASWLRSTAVPATEALPAVLQSRWIDAVQLPSKPLRPDEIRAAALAEVTSFRRIFGEAPKVAVPPTFIWNDAVETAWSEAGVQVVVTPGRRYVARDANGEAIAAGRKIVNGDRGTAGITYLVRDEYFEPARGHRAERGLGALTAKTRAGRPALLETHRANFLGDGAAPDAAIEELDRLLSLSLGAFPDLLFLSTEELASRMRGRDPELVERRIAVRINIWLRRVRGELARRWTWRRPGARQLRTG